MMITTTILFMIINAVINMIKLALKESSQQSLSLCRNTFFFFLHLLFGVVAYFVVIAVVVVVVVLERALF